jgi:hypothetical protein
MPYQTSKQANDWLRRHLDKLLVADLIEPSDSDWAAGLVLVPKDKDQYRICVDYRPRNKVLQAYAYPLPKIDYFYRLLVMQFGSRLWTH